MKITRDLTEKELCLLFILADGNGHPSHEIEKKLKIDQGNLSRLVNKLERERWIYRNKKTIYSKGSRGHKTEYPFYINQDKMPLVVKEIDRLIEIMKTEDKLEDLKMSEEAKRHNMLNSDGGFRLILKHINYLKWVETPLYQMELQKVYQENGFKNKEEFIKWQESRLNS